MTDPHRQAAGTRFQTSVQSIKELLPTIPTNWNPLAASIDELLNRVAHQLNTDSVWDTISEFFSGDIEDAVGKVRQMVDDIGHKLDETCATLNDEVNRSSKVYDLFTTASSLHNDVSNELYTLSADMPPSAKISDWKSPARTVFEERVTEQANVTKFTADGVGELATWLDGIGEANAHYVEQVNTEVTDIAGRVNRPPFEVRGNAGDQVIEFVPVLQEIHDGIQVAIKRIDDHRTELNSAFNERDNAYAHLNVPKPVGNTLLDDEWPKAVHR